LLYHEKWRQEIVQRAHALAIRSFSSYNEIAEKFIFVERKLCMSTLITRRSILPALLLVALLCVLALIILAVTAHGGPFEAGLGGFHGSLEASSQGLGGFHSS
jgi:hypothetical protein